MSKRSHFSQVRQNFVVKVIARSLKDEAFKQALLSNPRETLDREFGQALSPRVEIRVVEETPTLMYLVLPTARSASESCSD